MKILKAHRVRIYPTQDQLTLLLKTVGCARFVYNLALEQRSNFGRRGRKISFATWTAELKALKDEAPYLRDVPHHCLLQALKDLDQAFANFFAGTHAYPKPRKKFQNDSCRFPDPLQFEVGKDFLDLPKLGKVRMVAHRPIQGRIRSVTVSREGDHWYASILVKVRHSVPQRTAIVEGGIDVNVAQPIVESDGTKHELPRISPGEMRRRARLQKSLARKKRGSKNRAKARRALARFEAKLARRRRNAAQQATTRMARKYTHLAIEDLNVRGMTASAAGTVEAPGKNVRQKAGLNRAFLDVAPGSIRRQLTYKARWMGMVLTAVPPGYTSQTCSACGKHPKDDLATAHLAHGRISRDHFICPLCGFTCDADENAARNIRARGRQHWTAANENAGGSPVSACGASGGSRAIRTSAARRGKQEQRTVAPSGLPEVA